jgi:hypothetical protein
MIQPHRCIRKFKHYFANDHSCWRTSLSTPVELMPNASLQLLPEAAATQERRLEAVSCKALFK